MQFTILNTDLKSKARAGNIITAHGTIKTPIFMPVFRGRRLIRVCP